MMNLTALSTAVAIVCGLKNESFVELLSIGGGANGDVNQRRFVVCV